MILSLSCTDFSLLLIQAQKFGRKDHSREENLRIGGNAIRTYTNRSSRHRGTSKASVKLAFKPAESSDKSLTCDVIRKRKAAQTSGGSLLSINAPS